jgi:hypothetical protein
LAKQKGRIQKRLPPRMQKVHEYDEFAVLAQANPGDAVLAASQVNRSRYETVRQFRRAPYYTDDGRIRVHLRNSTVGSDGQRCGDIWFVWEPYESEEANATAND